MIKYIFVGISFILLSACFKEKRYCGKIIEKGYDHPTSGYKTSADPVYYIIMNVDSADIAIRVHLTIPAYYSFNVGDNACFQLTEQELSNYGNGSTHLIK